MGAESARSCGRQDGVAVQALTAIMAKEAGAGWLLVKLGRVLGENSLNYVQSCAEENISAKSNQWQPQLKKIITKYLA